MGQQTEWYTFADKNTRPFKVMARGLDPTTDPKAIIHDLEDKGFKILSATNILKTEYKKDSAEVEKRAKSQIKLRLFMLTFDNSESVDKIYEIKNIVYQAVKIEALRKNSTRIVQCKNCQGNTAAVTEELAVLNVLVNILPNRVLSWQILNPSA